jgi:8-oxo-dGTP pyrophosphatase MutT (NUDIX family)
VAGAERSGERSALDPAALRERLETRLGPDPGAREAEELAVSGVLVPIVTTPVGPLVLLTRRSEELPSHPGQISYPGGRREPGETLVQTALRETLEETGLASDDVDVLGHLTDVQTFKDDLVCVYVGLVDPPVDLEDPITPEEVTERLLVPLLGLIEGRSAAPSLPGSLAEPADQAVGTPYPVLDYEARSLELPEGAERVHYWSLAEDTTLWGISGEITAGLLADAFAWPPPAKPRVDETQYDLAP